MTETCAQPGALQTRIKEGWLPLFTPPPPPSYVPKEAFLEGMGKKIEARFVDTAAAVEKIRARGGKIVFVRFPMTGKLKEHEDATQPRSRAWTRLLNDTKAPGIDFEDFPELASFDCPEWSHLSAADSVEFTRRLVPYLRAALGNSRRRETINWAARAALLAPPPRGIWAGASRGTGHSAASPRSSGSSVPPRTNPSMLSCSSIRLAIAPAGGRGGEVEEGGGEGGASERLEHADIGWPKSQPQIEVVRFRVMAEDMQSDA